ncbi:MAG: hypothetical protein HXX09_01605 [Bacteroidetes bacterium]|nr:hypothetical protein [Bacteroidota bacterium]
MKAIFRNSIIFSFLLIFIASTGGINLYKSLCSCTGHETISFFKKESTCSLQHKSKDSEKETKYCCSKKKTSKKAKKCCSTTNKYLKVRSDFDALDAVQIKNHSEDFVFLVNLKSIITLKSKYLIKEIVPPDSVDPPLLFGKNLVFFLHQLKIDASDIA